MSRDSDNWGYEKDTIGPDQWPKYYPTGKFQSPINIIVNNCDQVAHSTCCGRANDQHAARLPEKFRDSLYVSGGGREQEKPAARRHHLDSIGEDHHRSSSTSSAGSSFSSSSSSSPVQNDTNSEDDDLNHGRHRSGHRSALSSHHKIADKGCERCVTQAHAQNTRYCVSNKKIFLGYPRYLSTMQLCNTGHTWQINLPAELATHTLLSGPPLGDREYRLAQFHCHWGEDCNHGSEHKINGKSFAAEIHFVHWNCSDFGSIEEASRHKHGLAVLAVFVQALEGEHENRNKHLEKIIAGLKRVNKPGSSVNIHARLDLKKLFPANRWSYVSYEGSLTTPPLSEVVDWVVFLNPIQCSIAQIEQFRQIGCVNHSHSAPKHGGQTMRNMMKNCRPVQPTNNRLVSIWTHH